MSRSDLMSRISGKNTRPEMRLRRALWARGLRYRLHHRAAAGRPDVVFMGQRVAVFIDGCFWHGCPAHYVRPRSRTGFWADKLRENVERDRRQTAELESQDWKVCRVWEHEVDEDLDSVTHRIAAIVRGGEREGKSESWRVTEVVPLNADGGLERRVMTRLRGPSAQRIVECQRTTAKWNRPSR